MNGLNNIYKSYKQRLISIDSRNSSFFLSKLNSKKHIDLVELARKLNQMDSLENFFTNLDHITFAKLELNKNKIIEIFIKKKEDYKEEIKSIIPIFKDSDFEYVESYIEKNTDIAKIKAFLNTLISKYETDSIRIIQQFSRLVKQTKMIERDLGKNDLYLGYPFIEGKFQNGKNFRAPLVLHRVELTEYSDSVRINVISDGKMINPVFLLSYLNENGKEYQRFEFEIPESTINFIAYAKEFLGFQNIRINDSIEKFEVIESITKSEYAKKYFNEINKYQIKNYCVLGLFPISNRSIYDDLDYLDKNPNKTSETLFNFLEGTKSIVDELDNTTPKESEIKYISPIDWSQRVVIKKALDQDLVIEGPPGTGKSQTIVNIIINLLLQDKKILVVSEKLAAIEVVYNRLGRLRENTLIIKDYIKNKESFFRQITESRESFEGYIELDNNNNFDSAIQEYIDTLKKINKKDYYQGKSFNELNAFIKGNKSDALTQEQNNVLRRLLKKYDSENMDIATQVKRLKYITSDIMYDRITRFKSLKQTEIYKQLGLSGISFFIHHNDGGFSKAHAQYNFFLHKLKKPIINKYEYPFFESGLEPRQAGISALENYVSVLYKNINLYKEQFLTVINPIYQDLKYDKSRIQLALKWESFDKDEKEKQVRKLFQPDFKQSFVKKLLKKPIRLTIQESSFVEYLDNYHGAFNIEHLKTLSENLRPTDIVIGCEYFKRNHSSIEELYGLLLNSDIFSYKDHSFDRVLQLFKDTISDKEVKLLGELTNLLEEEFDVVEVCHNIDIYDNFEDYISLLKIDQNIINEVQSIEKYIEDFNDKYLKVKESINGKYDSSFKTVYNHVKQNIRYKLGYNKQYNSLIGQAELKRKKSVKTIFKRYKEAILAAFPVVLMTPEVVSTVFDLEENLFDYVIFDEASQMFIERAIPAIIERRKSLLQVILSN